MKKQKLILVILSALLLCAVIFLLLARPAVRVVQETDGGKAAKWNVTVTALSFRRYHASSACTVEKEENGAWKACAVNPGMEDVKTGLYLILLDRPGKTAAVFSDLGRVWDLSAPGRYRVTVSLSRDERFTDPIEIKREFSVP